MPSQIYDPHNYLQQRQQQRGSGGALFVANHQLFGLDMGPLINSFYQKSNGQVYLRGLADHIHYGHPGGEVLRQFGAVHGTRDNVDCLMMKDNHHQQRQHDLLVYPGGQGEVLFKHSTEPSLSKYQLQWKQRLGFAKMAIKHGYPIVPVACVGVEDWLMDDGGLWYDMPIPSFLSRAKPGEKRETIPIVNPFRFLNPFRMSKMYFFIGKPIPTDHFRGEWGDDDRNAKEIRDQTKEAVEEYLKNFSIEETSCF